MKADDYLRQLLEESSLHQLTENEQELIDKFGVGDFIYLQLRSKKYRKFKMDDACIERTKRAINQRLQRKEPINVVYPQGGYKLWRFPSSPTADWAEFFNIAYVLEYIAPIATAYRPGVNIIYYMHTLLMELHDNLTREEIQSYVDSFQSLLKEFQTYLPKNIKISILRDADIYERQEYFTALEEGKNQAAEEYKKWPQSQKNDFTRMAQLNIKWKGKEDWTSLSELEKEKKIYNAALYESAATSQLKRVFEKVKSPENILLFTKGSKDFIGIGSTKASIAKYWVGYGVLQKRNDHFLPIILTPKQYEVAMKDNYDTVEVGIFDLKNFKEIKIFNSFDFMKS